MKHLTLGGEDAAWLHMESATSPMVVNGFLELGGKLAVSDVRSLVERVARIPRFRATIGAPAHELGLPQWVPARHLDLDHHLHHVELDDAGDGALRTFIGGAVSGHLDPSRPLWGVQVIEQPNRGTTLLFRVHHALADGFGLLGLMLSLCDEEPALEELIRTARPAVATPTFRGAASALDHLVRLPPDPKTILKRVGCLEKRVAWSAPLALDRAKAIAKSTHATVNDVLVSIVAGALRHHLERHGDHLTGADVHAMVPVNLRTDLHESSLGNRFGLVILGLPIGIDDPIARVAAAKSRMDALKASPEAIVAHELLRAIGRAPRRTESAVVSYFAKRSSLVLTNVPGPPVRLALSGVPISKIVFWVPQAGRMGLGISILSYAGQITVGAIADATVVPDPQRLVDGLVVELDALEAAVVRDAGGASGALRAPLAWTAWAESLEPV